MVRVSNPEDYILIGFRKSNKKNKKYDGILKNKKTSKIKHISFGDNRFENYRDKTGLNLYDNLIHGDKKRRKKFRKRHEKNAKYKYSSAWFSYHYLW